MVHHDTSPYVRAFLRDITRNAVLGLTLTVVFVGLGAWGLVSAVDQVTRTYEPTQVTVVDEHTQKQITGSRRHRHVEEVRVVTVTLPDGSSGTMTSEAVGVGETVTAYVDERSAHLSESRPEKPSLWTWALPTGALLAAAFCAAVVRHNLRQRSRLAAADLGTAPALDLQITEVRPDKAGKKTTLKIAATVVSSADAHLRPGDLIELTADADRVPGAIPPVLDGRVVTSGELTALLVLRAAQTDDPWWVGDVTNSTARKRAVSTTTA